jgi:hypothetical protein
MHDMRVIIPIQRILIVALLILAPVCRAQNKSATPMNAIAPEVKPVDIEAAVAAICAPADIIRSNNGSSSGCKKCPVGTQFHGENMGEWELRQVMAGHFTSANDNNLIVDGFNCDSHSENFGGTFVFSMSAGKPRLLKYDMGLITENCHKFRYTDGREFLVCRGGWSGQGEYDGNVFLVRFDAAGKDSQTTIFRTSFTTGSCGDSSNESVRGSDIKDMKFSSKDSGELTGMTITATNGTLSCAQAKVKPAPGKEPSSMKTYEIEFLFDGKQFTVAPASKLALRAFPQE